MPSLCENIKKKYEHLIKLTAQFTIKYAEAKRSGDLQDLKRLRKDLETARYALLEHLVVFSVPDAKNPYHEALMKAGLEAGETEEQQETILDISKEVQRQLTLYRETRDHYQKPCLEEWVKDITDNKH